MSDSDDDRPISELIKKRLHSQETLVENNRTSKKQSAEKSEDDDNKPISKLAKPNTRHEDKIESNSKRTSSVTQLQSEYYVDTEKGKLVQRLLVRWWYAIEWPKKEDIGIPPSGYEPLEGFLGVYISTKSESLGNIIDLRNKETCPSLRNISTWSCEKIKAKCIEAYESQMRVLNEIEGENEQLYNCLRRELKEVKSVDVQKAERDAKKYKFTGNK